MFNPFYPCFEEPSDIFTTSSSPGAFPGTPWEEGDYCYCSAPPPEVATVGCYMDAPVVVPLADEEDVPEADLMSWAPSTPPSPRVESWLRADEELPEWIKGEEGEEEVVKAAPAKLPTLYLPETPMPVLFALSTSAVLKYGVSVETKSGLVDFIITDPKQCYAAMQTVRCGEEQFTTDEAVRRELVRWIADFPPPCGRRASPKNPIILTLKARSHGSSRFAAIRSVVEETRTFFRQHSLVALTTPLQRY